MALQVIYTHLQMNYSVGAAFPPFHAKFFADKFLPTSGECLVVDPCAGWGGRLLGTLCVKRKDKVTYVGIDPETRNQEAYETLQGLYNKYLKKESKSERSSQIYHEKFEDWIDTDDALAAYYRAMAESEVTVESYRKYYAERLNVLIDRHQKSQSLAVQIDLTEGQLSNDEQLEFLTCVAIANGQVVSAEDSTDQ